MKHDLGILKYEAPDNIEIVYYLSYVFGNRVSKICPRRGRDVVAQDTINYQWLLDQGQTQI